MLDQVVAVARRLDMPRVLTDTLEQQGHLAAADNDPDRAIDLHHQALAERVEHGLRTFFVDSLEALAALTARAEPTPEPSAPRRQRRGARLHGLPARPRPPTGPPGDGRGPAGRLGDRPFRQAWADGARLTLDEAVAYVRQAVARAVGQPQAERTSPHRARRCSAGGRWAQQPGDRQPPLRPGRGTVKTHLSRLRQARGGQPDEAGHARRPPVQVPSYQGWTRILTCSSLWSMSWRNPPSTRPSSSMRSCPRAEPRVGRRPAARPERRSPAWRRKVSCYSRGSTGSRLTLLRTVELVPLPPASPGAGMIGTSETTEGRDNQHDCWNRQVVQRQQGLQLHQPESGNDVFVHGAIQDGGTLQDGQAVEFDITQDPKGPQATNVRAVAAQ